MIRKFMSAFVALMLVASVSQAQYTANFTTGTVNGSTNASYSGVYVGGYNGTLSGGTLPSAIAADGAFNKFWCLDFNGHFQNGAVVIRSFSDLIALNGGLTTKLTNIAKALTYADLQPTNAQDAAIHEFVWNQYNPGSPTWPLVTPVGIAGTSVDLDEFFLAEFDGVSDGQFPLGGQQELAFRSAAGGNLGVSTVPEPSTYALMTAGLIGIFGVARKRKQS